jgi:hypothetical protein
LFGIGQHCARELQVIKNLEINALKRRPRKEFKISVEKDSTVCCYSYPIAIR